MPKNIVLTGASGTVGFEALLQLLQNSDYNITVFDKRTPSSVKKLKPYSHLINIIYGDISDPKDVANIPQNQHVIIHLAAVIPPLADDFPTLAQKVNTIGTQNLINQIEQHSPNAFFMYSSSISVYGDRLDTPNISLNDELLPSSRDAYAVTKIDAEKIVRESNLDYTIFRLAASMGGHKMSKLMFHQPLNTSLEIATPADTARAFVNGIEKRPALSGRIFNLGGGKSCQTSYADYLEKSFEFYGLGKLDFPAKSFADKNFHCGFYVDGNDLENIVHFRQDSLATHYEFEASKVSSIKKIAASLLKKPIKQYLLRQSEPLHALKTNNLQEINHYFKS